MQLLTVILTDHECQVLSSKAALVSEDLVKPARYCLSPTWIHKLGDPLPTLARGAQTTKCFQNTLPMLLSVLYSVCNNQIFTSQREAPGQGTATQLWRPVL